MYRDVTQWLSIRNQILWKGISIRQVVRETGISHKTVRQPGDCHGYSSEVGHPRYCHFRMVKLTL